MICNPHYLARLATANAELHLCLDEMPPLEDAEFEKLHSSLCQATRIIENLISDEVNS